MSTPMNRWIKRFEAFARSKPADERYEYVSIFNCPYAQFLRRKRLTFAMVAPTFWIGLFLFVIPAFGRVPRKVDWAINWPCRNTFGALADRLSALIEDEGR